MIPEKNRNILEKRYYVNLQSLIPARQKSNGNFKNAQHLCISCSKQHLKHRNNQNLKHGNKVNVGNYWASTKEELVHIQKEAVMNFLKEKVIEHDVRLLYFNEAQEIVSAELANAV